MDIAEDGQHWTSTEYSPFVYDPWACYDTMQLYQLLFGQRSIRWCFFEVHPDLNPNFPLLHEFDDPSGMFFLPLVPYYRAEINDYPTVVKDSVLEGENQ